MVRGLYFGWKGAFSTNSKTFALSVRYAELPVMSHMSIEGQCGFVLLEETETGSHYSSTELALENGVSVFAEKPFSFSVLPYSTEELRTAKHDFELGKPKATYVCLDIAMSGVGTASCGPALKVEYRAPKEGENKFRILVK